MIIIEYSKYGIPNADLESEWLAREIYKRYTNYRSECDYTYQTSTDSLITAFRTLIAEQEIPFDKVVFKFNNEILKVDKYGQLEKGYPKGFCDSLETLLFRLIDTRRKNEAKRNED